MQRATWLMASCNTVQQAKPWPQQERYSPTITLKAAGSTAIS